MTEAVVHVEPAAPLTRVLQLMVNLKSRSFPVIGADHQLVGMISREDVIRALKEARQHRTINAWGTTPRCAGALDGDVLHGVKLTRRDTATAPSSFHGS